MPRFRAEFHRGNFDGELMDCYERPKDGQVIAMWRKPGRQMCLHQWSDRLSVWICTENVRKSDFMEVRK